MTLRRTNYMGTALLAATTLVVAACSSGGGGGGDMPAANTAPVISALTDRSVDQDTALGPLDVGISDSEAAADALTLTAAVDGDVFPADGVVFAGSGATRTLTLTPLESATGAGNVTVTLRDPQGLTTTRTFRVMVNAKNASIRELALTTFAKDESDEASVLNGYTFAQDADDPAIFESYVGEE